MSTYAVTAERSGKWWVLQADEVPGAISQVSRLDQADEIKEAIAWVADVPESEIEIEVVVSLPEYVQTHIERAAAFREAARVANAESAEESREVARALHEDLRLTLRDIGSVLEVSHQRAHQLVKGRSVADAPSTHGPVDIVVTGEGGLELRIEYRGGADAPNALRHSLVIGGRRG